MGKPSGKTPVGGQYSSRGSGFGFRRSMKRATDRRGRRSMVVAIFISRDRLDSGLGSYYFLNLGKFIYVK